MTYCLATAIRNSIAESTESAPSMFALLLVQFTLRPQRFEGLSSILVYGIPVRIVGMPSQDGNDATLRIDYRGGCAV